MKKSKENTKNPEVVIPISEEMMKSLEKLDKSIKGSGYVTDLYIYVHPYPMIGFRVNGSWLGLLNPSDTTKLMVQNAWSTTSRLRISIAWDDQKRVNRLVLTT